MLSVDRSWLELLTEIAPSTEPLLWSGFFFFLQGVCEKEQDFLSWAQVPALLHCCLSGFLSPGLVNSRVLRTLFITLEIFAGFILEMLRFCLEYLTVIPSGLFSV